MVKQSRAAVLPTNLPHLQNLIKRDSESYKEEFLLQWEHYQSSYAIFLSRPTEEGKRFVELLGFISHVVSCYPEYTGGFADQVAHLLYEQHANLSPEVREKLVQSLVILRKKGVITPTRLLEILLPLLTSTPSKTLRVHIYKTTITTLKDANKQQHKSPTLARTVQTLLFSFVGNKPIPGVTNLGTTSSTPPGVWAVRITSEMWRKGIWNDARSVELMKEAACSDTARVAIGGVQFFMGRDQQEDKDNSDSDDDLPDLKALRHGQQVGKKTKSKERQIALAKAALKKKERKAKSKPVSLNFSAIHLLHDPQAFAEVLFSKHLQKASSPLNITQKFIVLNLVTRLIASHKLILLGIYSWIMKYITPKQRDVTQVLACAAMASHEFIPPDVLETVVRKIADEFVTGGVSFEVLQAGLISIREICTRAPLVMNTDLLQDLTSYTSSRDKGVVNAARSLITLYREVAPEMLLRKDRGKTVSMAMSNGEVAPTLRFGVERGVKTGIEGLELLEAYKKEQNELDGEEDDEDDWKNWEVGSEEDEDSDESGGWIEVSSDEEHGIDISDSEDEEPKPPPPPKVDPSTSKLATTKILTPADLAKLEELRAKAVVEGPSKKSKKSEKRKSETFLDDEYVTPQSFLNNRKKARQDREEKIAHAAEGREGREKFASKKATRREDGPYTSTTNREKARKKNLMMTIHKIRKGSKGGLVGQGKKFRAIEKKRQKGKVKK